MTSRTTRTTRTTSASGNDSSSSSSRNSSSSSSSSNKFILILAICILSCVVNIAIYSEADSISLFSGSDSGSGSGTITVKESSNNKTNSTAKTKTTETTTAATSTSTSSSSSGNDNDNDNDSDSDSKDGDDASDLDSDSDSNSIIANGDHNNNNNTDDDIPLDVAASDDVSSSSSVISINNNTTTTTKKKKKKGKKKFILIHIGPSKTGTTSIQKDSGSQNDDFQHALDLDEVVYIGKFGPQLKRMPFLSSFRCMKDKFTNNLAYTIIADNANANARNGKATKKRHQQRQEMIDTCWSENKYILELSIIDSNEGYSYSVGEKFADTIKDIYKVFIEYLQYDEIIIVGAYRRYYDWLPSTYKESMKNYCLSYNLGYTNNPNRTIVIDGTRKKNCEPIWNYIMDYILQRKRRKGIKMYSTSKYHNIHETLPLAREVLLSLSSLSSSTSSASSTSTTTAATTNNNNNNKNNTHRVEILNYFQLKPNEKYYNSITTELYCNILGNDYTPNTCKYSRNAKAVVSHKGSLDNVPYKLIINAAQKRNWITGFSINYAKIENFINTTAIIQPTSTSTSTSNPSYIYTWEDLQEYHHTIITMQTQIINTNNNNTNGTTTNMLPLVCPSKKKLDTLLNESLSFEKLIMSESFIEDNILGEQKHIADFWKLADTDGAFCYIDINTLFGNAKTWEQFLKERMIITSW